MQKMHYDDIKRHLSIYSIYKRRKTTVNHAFAAAIALSDEFDEVVIKKAIRTLGQNPDESLLCVYCDSPAETWDHVFATVKNSSFSGAGHRIGNLLPCCKPCNSKKGNQAWDIYISSRDEDVSIRARRLERIKNYLSGHFFPDAIPTALPEYVQFIQIRDEILHLMIEADKVAATIRKKMKEQLPAQ